MTQRIFRLALFALFAIPALTQAASFQSVDYFGLPVQTSALVLSGDGSTLGASALNDSQAGRWRPGTGWDTFASSVLYTAWVTGISADGSVAVGNYGYEPDGGSAFAGASVGFTGATVAVPCASVGTASFEALASDGSTALRRHTCRDFSGSFPPNPVTYAVSLAGPTPTLLGTQPGFASSGSFGPLRLDAAGSVVAGYSADAAFASAQPFRWTAPGGFVAPPVPIDGRFGSSSLHTLSLSEDGTAIAGAHSSAGSHQAYVWRTGGVTFLGDLAGGAFDSRALALSADGSVVAGRGSSATGMEAFVWSDVTGLLGLGDLPGGGSSSLANLVSYDGSRVFGFGQSDEGQEAFVWDAANGMRRVEDMLVDDLGLDLTGWRLEIVTGISDDGTTIAGNGIDPTGLPLAWIAVIPEPGSGGLAFLSVGLLGLWRARGGSRVR